LRWIIVHSGHKKHIELRWLIKTSIHRKEPQGWDGGDWYLPGVRGGSCSYKSARTPNWWNYKNEYNMH
jgi:hypothetical protein